MTLIELRSAHATQSALGAALLSLPGRARDAASLDLLLALVVMKIATEAADERMRAVSASPGNSLVPARGPRALRVPTAARFDQLARAPLKGKVTRTMEALRALVDANPEDLSGTLNLEALWTSPPSDAEMDALIARLRIPALDFRALFGVERPDLCEAVDALLLDVGHRPHRAEAIEASTRLSRLLVALLDPAPNERIYDPLCQQGDLLVAAGRWVRSVHDTGAKLVAGEDPHAENARTARLRLLLQNDDPRSVVQRDALQVLAPRVALGEEDGGVDRVDVALCRPPLTLSWRNEGAGHDAFDRFHFGVAPRRRAHFALIQHMRSRLDPRHGRMAIVVPQGVLFRRGEEAEIRTALLACNEVETVVSLPERMVPGHAAACAVLILRRQRRDTSILFVDARQLPQDARSGAWMDTAVIDRVLDICHARTCVPGIAALVPGEQVIASGGCLSASRHVPTVAEVRPVSNLASLRAERDTLTGQLLSMQRELDAEIDALADALQPGTQAGCDIVEDAMLPDRSRRC